MFERFVYNKRLQLAHEEIVRPMSMGNDWNIIRIAVRCAINDAPRSATYSGISSMALYVGVRNGSTGASLFSDSVPDWVGGGLIGNTYPPAGPNSSFNAGTPNTYGAVSRPCAMRKTGSSVTFGTEASVNAFLPGTGAPGLYGAGFMSYVVTDITRGATGTSFTVTTSYCINSAAAQVNITDAVFMNALAAGGTPANLTVPSASVVTYSGAGYFDTLSIAAWRSNPHYEIDSIGVCRYS